MLFSSPVQVGGGREEDFRKMSVLLGKYNAGTRFWRFANE